ncbi:MAG: MFS transporter [Bacilli bacterium]|nr:MFS transporter [Bacilli bacterium]
MKHKNQILIAILSLSTFILSYMLITPIVANIYDNFPASDLNEIQLIVTLVPLASIVSMLFCNILIKKISMKNITLLGLIIILLAGLLIFLSKPDIKLLYISSILLGLGIGLITVISSTLISDHFNGQDKIKVMGYQSIAVSLGATLFSYFSGIFAKTNWQLSYSCFFVSILVFFIVALLLPNDKPLKTKSNHSSKLPGRVYLLGFISILFFIGINVFNTSISMLVKDSGYNSYMSGIVTAIYTIIGIVAGLVLNKVVKIFKKQTLTFASFLAFLGFLIIGFFSNILFIYVGAILLGFAFATRNPAGITFSANMVDKDHSALAIAIFNIGGQIGAFLSPLIINYITDSLNGNIHSMFIITSIFMLFVTIIHFLLNPLQNKDIIK